MSNRKVTSVVGGAGIIGIAAGLAWFAAKNAREVERQEEILQHLTGLPGVEVAEVDVRTPVTPWQQTRVSGVVCLSSSGIDEFEDRFDECVRVIRAVLDGHHDYTADIDLHAEPVDAALPADAPVHA